MIRTQNTADGRTLVCEAQISKHCPYSLRDPLRRRGSRSQVHSHAGPRDARRNLGLIFGRPRDDERDAVTGRLRSLRW